MNVPDFWPRWELCVKAQFPTLLLHVKICVRMFVYFAVVLKFSIETEELVWTLAPGRTETEREFDQ